MTIKLSGRKIRSLAGLAEAIDAIPRKIRGKAVKVAADFLMRKFKLYPRYKEVSRSAAYPEVNGFFSEKQRRFVMAGIADGTIQPGSPHRTMKAKNAWHIVGSGTKLSVVNDAPAAEVLYSPVYQARQLDMVGWKDINEMTDENLNDALLETEVFIYNEAVKEVKSF